MTKTNTILNGALILFLVTATPASALEPAPFLGMVPKHCWAYEKADGWGIKCPDFVNEQSFKRQRDRPASTLPGHSSDDGAFVPSVDESPEQCVVAIEELTLRAGQFTSWLRGVRFGGDFNGVLTGDAAYEVGQIIHSYTLQMEEEGKRKYLHSRRGGNGDQLCTDHVNFAISEIIRIAQLVIDEANKGNRDLTGTGLNAYESPYNK